MRTLSSKVASLKNKHYLRAWILFHGVVLLLFVLRLLFGNERLYFDADLMNMIPAPSEEPAVRVINDELTAGSLSMARVFFCHEDFDKAKELAETAYRRLSGNPLFESVTLYENTSYAGDVLDFIHGYRWNLIDEETADAILAPGGAETFAENALAKAYGAFTLTGLRYLDDDPFLLTDHAAATYLDAFNSTGIQFPTHQGVQAIQHDGKWYVAILVAVKQEYAGVSGKMNGALAIYNECRPLEGGEVRILYHGTPFTTCQTSQRATNELSLITSVSMALVVIILLAVFKSPVPIVSSVAAIGLSFGAALAATFAVFGSVHVLALLLGTSLIGSCLDYSLHYFVNWKANKKLSSPREIRLSILRGLVLSLGSTVLCYTVLVLIPYPMVKQMALFCITGLFSSFLTTTAIYPYLPMPKESTRVIRSVRIVAMPDGYNKKLAGRWSMGIVFALFLTLVVVCSGRISIFNDLDHVYSLKGMVLEDRREIDSFLQFSLYGTPDDVPYGWFIVKGDSEDEVIEREKVLAKWSYDYCKDNAYSLNSMGVSNFVPSEAAQRKSREAVRKLLQLVPEQYERLGYEPEYADGLVRSFEETEGRWLSLQSDDIPPYLLEGLSALWKGEIDGRYYSVLIPCISYDDSGYREISKTDPNVCYVNKMYDISRNLDKVTSMILMFFILAYVVMFVALKFFYPLKQTLKIVSIPILIMLVITGVYAVAGQPLEFFSIAGMILVLGLGLDYVIYMMENEKRFKGTEDALLEPYAIFLSFVSTVISFGALSLSSFAPVHYMGLAIFIGLVTAYFSSVLYDRS